VYPDHSKYRRGVNAGQIFRFTREIDKGDYVLTYLKAEREYLVGTVTGPYQYRPEAFDADYPHVRPVDWLGKVSRDDFTAPARNSMGSTLTVFSLDDYANEIERLISGAPATEEEAEDLEEETPPFYDEVKAQADELIADLIHQLDPFDFQDLVAAVLRAMGFQAVSTDPGPDRGIDIVAHPDAFGFEKPRIKAQVKHRKSTTGGPDMRSFIGTLRSGESGLYVSTGGFTRDARREAEHAHEPVSLLDRDEFIQLLLEHYEELESEYKAQIPLRRLWVPAE
jgi:restriction system protein